MVETSVRPRSSEQNRREDNNLEAMLVPRNALEGMAFLGWRGKECRCIYMLGILVVALGDNGIEAGGRHPLFESTSSTEFLIL